MTTTSETPPENMSVRELREWLKTFEKNQKDHFQKNQVARRRSPISTASAAFRRFSVRDRIVGLEKPRTNPNNNSAVPVPNNDADSESEVNSQQENNVPMMANKHTKSTTKMGPSAKKRFETSSNVVPSNNQCPSEVTKQNPVEKTKKTEPTSMKLVENENPLFSLAFDKAFTVAKRGNEQEPSNVPDLCLALSAVTMASSSSSVEVEASESTDEAEDEAEDLELGETTSADTFDMIPDKDLFQEPDFPAVDDSQVSMWVNQTVQPKVLKAVPEAFSDFEPNDFDASDEASAESEKEEKEDAFGPTGSDHWPSWNGDVRQYLKKQAQPAFGGYWSDKELNDESVDDEDDDNSLATGRRTEPPRLRSKSSRNSHFEEDTLAPSNSFTLADAALGSMAAPSRRRTLSDHLAGNDRKSNNEDGKMMLTKEPSSPTSMHSANLFQNKTLTSGALDRICNGKAESEQNKSNKLESFFERSDQGTIYSWSADSGKPSVAPDAVDAKLLKVFSLDSSEQKMKNSTSLMARNGTEATFSSASSLPNTNANEKRQPSQMKSMSIDTRQGYPSQTQFKMVMKETEPFIVGPSSFSKTIEPTATTDSSNTISPTTSEEVSPASSFSSVIQKFGGGGRRETRKTRIQRRKESLEEQWSANRQVKHVKKTKWQVGNSGVYKKRIVLDYEEK